MIQDGEREADARATLQWLEHERIIEGSIEDFARRCASHVLALVVERDAAERALADVRKVSKRLTEHLGYCPHATPEDEAAGQILAACCLRDVK